MVTGGCGHTRVLGMSTCVRSAWFKRVRSAILVAAFAALPAWAQVSVNDGGTASYSYPIAVPPGIAGMSPNLGLSYSGSGSNGPVGYGWGLQGISTISRCPQTRGIDGFTRGVTFTSDDKLCLDGQRLIQTDASGVVVNGSVTNPSSTNIFQSGDSLGGSAGAAIREYRTEKDSFARIRAYGAAGSLAANGPAYFKVWTKSGQIYEYGASPSADANTNALVAAQGTSVAMVWAVSRISDTLGNYIDFKYIQRDTAWGSGPSSGPQLGREWNLAEIQYTGNGAQVPANKVVFDYVDRANNPGGPQDRVEAYQAGSKNVSIWRLRAIRTYVNWPGPALGVTAQGTTYPAVPVAPSSVGNTVVPPAGAIKVKTVKITYTQGPTTGRSLVSGIAECAGANEDKCSPAPSFQYSAGGSQSFQPNTVFAAGTLSTTIKMIDATANNFGVVLGDFDGDGKTDILRWGNTASDNQLWRSNGDGGFTQATAFNLTTTRLFSNDGCYSSIVADFNGDGVTDILRTVQATNSGGTACSNGSDTNLLFIGNGDGSFQTGKTLTGIDLSAVRERFISQQTTCPPGEGDPCFSTLKTIGRSFLVLDANGDGVLDIITSINPSNTRDLTHPAPTPDEACASIVCTHVYLGSLGGTFTELTTTNLAHHSVYSDPVPKNQYAGPLRPNTVDVDGDGLTDLVVITGTWRSSGDGNFSLVASNVGTTACTNPIDFNGDGRVDCIRPALPGSTTDLLVTTGVAPTTSGTFNLTGTGKELYGVNASQQQNIGMLIGDFNRDGRSGILRWEDSAASNVLYLSNGDGTFRTVTPSGLTGANQVLRSSDGTRSYVAGDFTGRGSLEILRLRDTPTAGSEGTTNQLYEKTDKSPADQLLSVTSPTGLKTTLWWVPLSNPYYVGANGSFSSYPRYVSDRGTPASPNANAAVYPMVDLTLPTYVVATSVSDTGVGSSTVATEYAYVGLKADLNRGLLGFRQTARQFPAANGTSLTRTSQYLQVSPYIGAASRAWTQLNTLWSAWSQAGALSTTTSLYCDKTAVAGAEATATSTQVSCPTSAKVQKPYLFTTVETGTDPAGYALPTVTTVNGFDQGGNPTSIAITSSGTALGLSQTFTKTTTNVYLADNTAGDNWVLGRLQQATQRNTVPNSLPSITTSAGSATNASATQGTAFATLSAVSFGSVTVGGAQTLNATVANAGGVALAVTVPSASSVTGAGFTFVSTTCSAILAASSSCTISVKLSPTAVTPYSGNLSVVTGVATLNGALTGSGANPSVVYQPVSTNWGTVGVYSDSGDWPTITNNSNVSVLITAHSPVSGPAQVWSWQGQSGFCQPGATVLPPGASCQTFFGTGGLATPGAYSATDQISYQVVGATGTTFTVQQSYSFAIAATTANSSGLSFGNVAANTTSGTQTFTLTNNAGNSPVNIALSMVGNQPANFPMTHNCGSNLAAGASCTVTVSFNPTWVGNGFSAAVQIATTYPRMRGGTVEAYYNAAPAFTVSVSGNGTGSNATMTSASSQTYPTDWAQTATRTVTLSYQNTGNAPLTLNSPSVNAPLTVTANNCNNVAPGASCSIDVANLYNVAVVGGSQAIQPAGALAGPAAATLNYTVNSTNPGWGVASLDFGSVVIGGSTSRTVSLINYGLGAAFNFSAVQNRPAPYTFNMSACSSVAPNGGTCTVTVTFSPTAAGTSAGSGIYAAGADSFIHDYLSVSGVGLTQPALALSGCTASNSTAPAAASYTCSISNGGQGALSSISYSTAAGTSISGPTGACAGGAVCGTVTVTTSTTAGTYAGSFTATPNTGTGASGSFSLVVTSYTVPTFSPASLNLSSNSANPPSSVTSTITLTNPAANPTLVINGISLPAAENGLFTFSVVGGTCAVSGVLAPGGSCTLSIKGAGTSQCDSGDTWLTVSFNGYASATASVLRGYRKTTLNC